MRNFIFASIIGLMFAAAGQAQEPTNLRKQSPCVWDALFQSGSSIVPCGRTSGEVLWSAGCRPRVKARLQDTVWQGKTFRSDGSFVNRWLGFEAISACVTIEPSVLDGRPAVVLAYPEGTPVFGGVRDELRCIGPGVWLGRGVKDGGRVVSYFLLRTAKD